MGLTYDPEVTKQDRWYTLHTWNTAQYEWFLSRAIRYLVRKGMNKRSAEQQIMWWNLQYGWKDAKE